MLLFVRIFAFFRSLLSFYCYCCSSHSIYYVCIHARLSSVKKFLSMCCESITRQFSLTMWNARPNICVYRNVFVRLPLLYKYINRLCTSVRLRFLSAYGENVNYATDFVRVFLCNAASVCCWCLSSGKFFLSFSAISAIFGCTQHTQTFISKLCQKLKHFLPARCAPDI